MSMRSSTATSRCWVSSSNRWAARASTADYNATFVLSGSIQAWNSHKKHMLKADS